MIELVCIYNNQYPYPSWLDQNWVNGITHKIQQQPSQTIQVKLVLVDASVNPIPSPYIEFLHHKIPNDYPVFFMYEKTLSNSHILEGQHWSNQNSIEDLILRYFTP